MAEFRKAIVGAVTTAVAAFTTGVPGCNLGTGQRVGIAAAAGVIALAAVYFTPNAPTKP